MSKISKTIEKLSYDNTLAIVRETFDDNNENKLNELDSKEESSLANKMLQIQKDEFSQTKQSTLTRFDYGFYNQNKEIVNESEDNNVNNSTIISKPKEVPKISFYGTNKTPQDYRAYQFKVIMLGNIAVGKTCLLSFFVDSVFKENYTCTVGVDFKVKTVVLGPSIKVDLQIWDTSGEERFRTITKQYYRDAAGIVLVFDVTNEKSFTDIGQWIDDINLIAKKNVRLILVGNKQDMVNERVISTEVARRFADKNNLVYYETSAKTGHQVQEIFEKLSEEMVNSFEADLAVKKKEQEEDSIPGSSTNKNNIIHVDLKSERSKKPNKNCC